MRWNKSECVFIGFYVEKGFGRQAANSGKPNEILGSNWLWPQILQGAKNGLLDSPIRAVLQRAGLPIIVCMNSYLSKRTTGGTSEPIDEVQFVIRTSDLNLTNMLEGKKIFADLNDSRDLPELMRRIEDLEEAGWYWFNLWFGIKLRYRGDDTGEWDSAKIWHNVMEPWMSWVQ